MTQNPMIEVEPAAPAYGIIDPDYARVFTIARVLAWTEGYAMTMHGSFTRDLDLVAIPWTDQACEPDHLVRRIRDATGLSLVNKTPGTKPHGRTAWTLVFPKFGDPRFVDMSVMPRLPALPALNQPEAGDVHPDDLAVDRFADAMKAKLAKKRTEGRGGWNDRNDCSNEFLSRLLREHVGKGDPVDVGNFAMMIHQRGERIG